MLPYSLQRACNKLVDAPKFDAKAKQWTEPTHEYLVSLFLQILEALESCRGDPGYPLYVRTVFGYRRLVERDGACVRVDSLMLKLLQDRPEIIPDDCYADRLPPSAPVLRQIEALRRASLNSELGTASMECLAAD